MFYNCVVSSVYAILSALHSLVIFRIFKVILFMILEETKAKALTGNDVYKCAFSMLLYQCFLSSELNTIHE